MASEGEIEAAAEALTKLLGVALGKAIEAARAALEAAERVRAPEPEEGDFVG